MIARNLRPTSISSLTISSTADIIYVENVTKTREIRINLRTRYTGRISSRYYYSTEISKKDDVILGSGASFHVFNDPKWF